MFIQKISKTVYRINKEIIDLKSKNNKRFGRGFRKTYGVRQALEEYILNKNTSITPLRADTMACNFVNRNLDMIRAIETGYCIVN